MKKSSKERKVVSCKKEEKIEERENC